MGTPRATATRGRLLTIDLAGLPIDLQIEPPGGLRGTLRIQAACTRMACAPQNRCCNTCSLTVMADPTEGDFVGRPVQISGHRCRVDGCGQVTGCDLVDGALYTFPRVDVKCRGNECFGAIQ